MSCVDCRKNRDGIIAKIDDDMLRHYCNEDVFLMQVCHSSPNHSVLLIHALNKSLMQVMVTESPCGTEDTMVYDITLSEIQSAMEANSH